MKKGSKSENKNLFGIPPNVLAAVVVIAIIILVFVCVNLLFNASKNNSESGEILRNVGIFSSSGENPSGRGSTSDDVCDSDGDGEKDSGWLCDYDSDGTKDHCWICDSNEEDEDTKLNSCWLYDSVGDDGVKDSCGKCDETCKPCIEACTKGGSDDFIEGSSDYSCEKTGKYECYTTSPPEKHCVAHSWDCECNEICDPCTQICDLATKKCTSSDYIGYCPDGRCVKDFADCTCNPACTVCLKTCKGGECEKTRNIICPDGSCNPPAQCSNNCNPHCDTCIERCLFGICRKLLTNPRQRCPDGRCIDARDKC